MCFVCTLGHNVSSLNLLWNCWKQFTHKHGYCKHTIHHLHCYQRDSCWATSCLDSYKAVIKQALGLLSYQCHTRTITNHAVHTEKGPSITDSHPTQLHGVHWPCTESEGCLHRGTPDSGWPSVHTDPSTSLPPARGWSATSSQPAPLAPWGCRMMAPSHWLSPASQDRKTETESWIWVLTTSQKDTFSWILFSEYIIVESGHNRSKNTSEETWECIQDLNRILFTDILFRGEIYATDLCVPPTSSTTINLVTSRVCACWNW